MVSGPSDQFEVTTEQSIQSKSQASRESKDQNVLVANQLTKCT